MDTVSLVVVATHINIWNFEDIIDGYSPLFSDML